MTTETVRINELGTQVEPLDTTGLGSGLGHRVMALTVLAAALSGGAFVVVTGVRLVTDAWVAPLQLSPDMDLVVALRLSHARQEAELARAEAEVQRLDTDLAALSGAIERLSALRGVGRQTLAWQSGAGDEEARQLESNLRHLEDQRVVLERLLSRQRALTARTRTDLAAGLVDRTELERQEQSLDSLEVSLLDNTKEHDATSFRLRQVLQESRALRGTTRPGARQRNPVVAASEEHAARVEVELLRLESERRGLETMRRVAAENIDRQRALLDELRARPLYRAMTATLDVAFVPYSQLDGIETGAKVLDCALSLVNCREVGVVAELLPGEVVTQDPWGNPARGRYAVLTLDDPAAIREKVLRLRPG